MKTKKLTEEEKHVIEAPAISEEKELILSKESGKPLVKTEFDGKSYKVIEPTISEQDKKLLDELKTYRLDENSINQVQNLCKKYNILFSKEYYDKLRYYLVRDKNRYGKIFYGLISIVISCVLLYGEVAIGVTLFGSFKEFGLIILVFLAIMIIFLVSRRWFMPDEE